ncbi:hypothetical protein PR048_009769 [Dryococelus australis]|uniref:Uncharacterized protein n=1 Tax=Dryococelus australis TaxID=614101 RepID=A0ABQ9I0V0_9NEOP|nr:hypothetical protein PR048_009769 [Dryococelus australis]
MAAKLHVIGRCDSLTLTAWMYTGYTQGNFSKASGKLEVTTNVRHMVDPKREGRIVKVERFGLLLTGILRVVEIEARQRRNAKARKREILEKKPADQRHRSACITCTYENPGATPVVTEPCSPWWGTSALAAEPLRPLEDKERWITQVALLATRFRYGQTKLWSSTVIKRQGKREIPRENPSDQRHHPARFPHAKIRINIVTRLQQNLITPGQSPKDQCGCHGNLSTKMPGVVIYPTGWLTNSIKARTSQYSLRDYPNRRHLPKLSHGFFYKAHESFFKTFTIHFGFPISDTCLFAILWNKKMKVADTQEESHSHSNNITSSAGLSVDREVICVTRKHPTPLSRYIKRCDNFKDTKSANDSFFPENT